MSQSGNKIEKGGLLSIIRDLFDEPLPKGVGWPHTLGSSLLALVSVQVVTGILLSLYYSPNAEVAYESVQYIENRVLFGSLIRGLHYFAASGMIILLFLHMVRTFFSGSYKPPRQWTWIFGVGLLFIVLGFAFTGYLLPWDMKAYFATKVGINMAGVVPLLGELIVKIMQGSSEMGALTLSRFYSLHVVILPLALVLLVGGHLFYLRLHGTTPPWRRNDEPVEYTSRFYPSQLFRDSLVALLIIGVLVVLAAKFGAPLEEQADPNDTRYIPRPDWYFYSLFQLLKIFEGKLEIIGAVILPGAFFTVLLLLPFIDRNPERMLSKRPVAVTSGSMTVFLIVLLTAWGAYEGRQSQKALAAKQATVTVEGEIVEPFVVDPVMGKQLYDALKCAECHAQPSQDENLPPGLEFAGNKFQQAWLIEYLQNPHRIRWQKKDERPVVRMPDFHLTDREATNLSAYLLSNKQNRKFPELEFDWAEADSEMVESGMDLFTEYGCFGCHKIGDEGQNIAPELSHAGSKLLESYMYHLIKSPHDIIPGTSMKDFRLEQEEVEDLVAYLRGLK
ncbi:MAG: cytochrome b N-terminal domain-containing protein [bacterium]